MRSISNLMAVLILLSIVVGVGIGVALLTGAMTQRLQPTGSGLNIQNIRVQALTSNRRYILVEVVATVTGAQSIRIRYVYIYWQRGNNILTSRSTTPLKPSINQYFAPGATLTIIARFNNVYNPPGDYSPVRVIIEFCDTSGKCYMVSGSGVLEPYRP